MFVTREKQQQKQGKQDILIELYSRIKVILCL